MNLRHLALPCLIPLLWLIACDRNQPVAPALEAGVSGVGGPTVKAPSNTNASAASDTRIDVSWQDNSTNETGFDVWRSSRSEEHTSELQSRLHLVCRLLLEKKKQTRIQESRTKQVNT